MCGLCTGNYVIRVFMFVFFLVFIILISISHLFLNKSLFTLEFTQYKTREPVKVECYFKNDNDGGGVMGLEVAVCRK